MAARLTWAGIVLAILALGLLGAVSISSAQETDSSLTCDQTVRHTAFMAEEAISAVNETGSATSRASNTVVVVEEVTGFVRLKADNPNGYCVAYVVEISPEIVPPADLGHIESNGGELEATWRAVHNLSSGSIKTQVEFTLDAGENATFAPSTVRVKSLAWTGTAKRTGGSLFSSVTDLWGSQVLDQREYTIEATESASAITVPLEDGEGREVEDWIASYDLDGRNRAVTQDASEPVFYTESAGSVTFHFNDRSAKVTFIAEPTVVDRWSHSADSYLSGIGDIGEWLPFYLSPLVGGPTA